MKNWNSLEDAHRYYKAEGFFVGKCICRECGHEDEGCVHPEANLERLLCSECGEANSLFIHHEFKNKTP